MESQVSRVLKDQMELLVLKETMEQLAHKEVMEVTE